MNRRNMPATYKQIDAYLGSKDARTIANNTTARRGESSDASATPIISVYLHGHEIATLASRWIGIRDAGWQTVTTKDRLNRLLAPIGYSISQKDYCWTLYSPDGSEPWDGSASIQLQED